MTKTLTLEQAVKIKNLGVSKLRKEHADEYGFKTVKQLKEEFKNIPEFKRRGLLSQNSKPIFSYYVYKETYKRFVTYFKLNPCKPSYDYEMGTIYLSHSNKWGDYNPEYYVSFISIRKIDENNNIKIIEESDVLGYHMREYTMKNSKHCNVNSTYYRDSKLIDYKVIYKGRKLYHQKEMIIGKTVWHYDPTKETDYSAYKNLKEKITLKKEQAKEKREARKAEKEQKQKDLKARFDELKSFPITYDMIKERFNFCDYGIDDFCNKLGLNNRKATNVEVLVKFYSAPKRVQESLNYEYYDEVETILAFCKRVG